MFVKEKLDKILKNHNISRTDVRRLMDYAKEQLESSFWSPGFDFPIEKEMLRFDIHMKSRRIWYEICNEEGEVLYKNIWTLGQDDEEPLDEIIRYYLILRKREILSFEEYI